MRTAAQGWWWHLWPNIRAYNDPCIGYSYAYQKMPPQGNLCMHGITLYMDWGVLGLEWTSLLRLE